MPTENLTMGWRSFKIHFLVLSHGFPTGELVSGNERTSQEKKYLTGAERQHSIFNFTIWCIEWMQRGHAAIGGHFYCLIARGEGKGKRANLCTNMYFRVFFQNGLCGHK